MGRETKRNTPVSGRALSVLLSVVLVLLTVFSAGSPAMAAADNTERDIVLILDTSGSMSGRPITALREAAAQFCETILAGTTNTRIALVVFDSSATLLCDFSTDMTALSDRTGSLWAGGSTDMADALQTADTQLTNSARPAAQKSIVLMTDGLPEKGPSYAENDARYLYSEYGQFSNYASGVYNYVQSIADRNYFIFTLGFFHGLSGQSLKLGQALLYDIQNAGYFEVSEIDQLLEEFVKIAQTIVQPLAVTLSHTETGVTHGIKDINPGLTTYVNIYDYEITANIKNDNTQEVLNVSARIELDGGLALAEGNDTRTVTRIAAGESAAVTWAVHLPDVVADRDCTYTVSVESDNTLPVAAYGNIFARGTTISNNFLVFGRDTWNFPNFSMAPMPITDDDFAALTWDVSDALKASMSNWREEGSNGYCYGMSVTAVLAKMGRLDPRTLDPTAGCLYNVSQNDGQSSIAYYQMTQKLPAVCDEIADFSERTVAERLQIIMDLALQVEQGGAPFVFGFGLPGGAHAVVGYGYERGSFINNTYDSRILIYDNNSPTQNHDCDLYFNEGTNDWHIPAYSDATRLMLACADINILDVENLDSNKKTVRSYMSAKKTTDLLIQHNGASYAVNGTDTHGSGNIFAYYTFAGDADLNIVLKNPSAGESVCVIEPQRKGEALDLSILYDGYYLSAGAPGADAVSFDPTGHVGLEGNVQGFSLEMTGNSSHHKLPWRTVKIAGTQAANPELQDADAGCFLNAKNMSGITVTGINDVETKEVTFTTGRDSVLISQLDGELAVYTDETGDGTYGNLLASSGKPPDPTPPPSSPTPPKDDTPPPQDGGPSALGPILLAVFAVLLFAGILFFTSKSGSKPSGASFPPPIAEAPQSVRSGAVTVTTGSLKGASVAVGDGETVYLGKEAISHIAFPDDYKNVSRQHCTVTYHQENNMYTVTDTSSNGTFVDKNVRLSKGSPTTVPPGSALTLANDGCTVQLQ